MRSCLLGVFFSSALLLLFWPTLVWMAQRFEAHDSFYSHGWLIPVASGWLIWRSRVALAATKRQGSLWGLLLLVPSVAVHVIATWWDLHFVSGFTMMAAVWATVWTLWGFQTLWVLRVGLLFLLFMVPLPSILLISISFKLKLIAAMLATNLLTLLGMPAHQAGSTIHVPGASVIVDDACSGLRSLISLVALTSLWTCLVGPSFKRWHKAVLLASSIPIALAANMTRILVLVFLTAIYGPKIAEGFIHYGSGLVVFGLALLALVWLSQCMIKPEPASGMLS